MSKQREGQRPTLRNWTSKRATCLIVLASDPGRWSTPDVDKLARLPHGATGNALQGLFTAYNPKMVDRLGDGWWQVTPEGIVEAKRLQDIRDELAEKAAKRAGQGTDHSGKTAADRPPRPAQETPSPSAGVIPGSGGEGLPTLSELAETLTKAAAREVSEEELMREGMGWQPHKSAETVKSAPPLGPVPEPDSQDEVVFPEDEPIPELSLEALLLLLIGRLDDIGVLTVKARRYDQMGVNFEAFMDAVRRRQNEA